MNVVSYTRGYVDDYSLELLKKLKNPEFTREQIEKEHCSLINVRIDEKVVGVLIVRGELSTSQELTLVVLHVIAANHIDESFSGLLGKSLRQWAGQHGFKYIRIHSDRPGLSKLCERENLRIFETVYITETEK
jgi:hypothetical protein